MHGIDGGRVADIDADFAAAWSDGKIAAAYNERDYSRALRETMRLADIANQYVNDHKPWSWPNRTARRPTCTRCAAVH